jgi:hypothetical protein
MHIFVLEYIRNTKVLGFITYFLKHFLSMQTAALINKFCTAPHSVGFICNNHNKVASAGESAAMQEGSKL